MGIQQDIRSLDAMALVELFELDATSAGGSIMRFHNGKSGLGTDVVWQGNTYTAFPIEATGFDFSGKGQLPRPNLRVANVTGLLGALVRTYQDLLGCKLTRKRTLAKYLDSANYPIGPMPGPTVEFTRASIGTYFGSDGLLKTAASGAPRFQYDTSAALVNFVTNSDSISGAAFFNPGVGAFTDNGLFSVSTPYGTQQARKITVTTTARVRWGDIVNGSTNTSYTGAIWVATADGQARAAELYTNIGGGTQSLTITPAFQFFAQSGSNNSTNPHRFCDLNNLPPGEYFIGRVGVMYGAYSAAQILAAGGIPPTTTTIAYGNVTPKGLLVEESRTNLAQQSGDMTRAEWVKSPALTPTKNQVGLDGSANSACSLAITGAAANYAAPPTPTLAVSTVHTTYAILKAGTVSTLAFEINNNGTNIVPTFNLATGVAVGAGGGTASIVDLGGGIKMCVFTWTSGATGTQKFNVIYFGAYGNAPATGTMNFYGFQLEVGSSASSYIPTTTAAVTRAADVPKLTGTNFSSWFNAAQGTFVYDVATISAKASQQSIICADDGTINNRIELALQGAGIVRSQVVQGGAAQADIFGGAASWNTQFSYALAYAASDFVAYKSGAQIGTDTAGALPTVDRLIIGNRSGNSGDTPVSMVISRLRYYATRLSNADLQTLSAGGSVSAVPALDADFTKGSLQTTVLGNYNPLADPTAALPDDVYFIDRKATESKVMIEFELSASFDVAGVQLPRRFIIQNVCQWAYKGAECSYTGTSYFDTSDQPVASSGQDVCGKRLSSCKARFGAYNELPYGGFPASGLVR